MSRSAGKKWEQNASPCLLSFFFLFFKFKSLLSLNCSVLSAFVCTFSFFLLLLLCLYFGHVSIVSKPVLRVPPLCFLSCLCADWPRSPLAHGCRSTHNSPVHSACSSQRLSQNFSVSVPTLIFTGTLGRISDQGEH